MPRQRTELGPEKDAEIAARAARGESAETIAAAMGLPSMARTIRRRVDELRGRAPAKAAAPSPAAPGRAESMTPAPSSPGRPPTFELADDVPVEVPEGTPTEQIDRWLRTCEKALERAEAQGNLAAVGSLAQKAAALLALRHRTAPLPKADPNDRPDYAELARIGEERLLKLIRGTFANVGVARP